MTRERLRVAARRLPGGPPITATRSADLLAAAPEGAAR